jgi:thymidylate synthase
MSWFNLMNKFASNYYSVGDKLEKTNFSFSFSSVDTARICPIYFNGPLSWYHIYWYITRERNNVDFKFFDYFRQNYKEPYYNSNYGYWWFEKPQAKYVIDTLLSDKNSRQANIIMNTPDNMMIDNDKVCTNSITFLIRENKLQMSIHMRSSNFINLTCDMFTFCFLYDLIYMQLSCLYSGLEKGEVYFSAVSFHINKIEYDSLHIKGERVYFPNEFEDYPKMSLMESTLMLNNCINYYECSDNFITTLINNINTITNG